VVSLLHYSSASGPSSAGESVIQVVFRKIAALIFTLALQNRRTTGSVTWCCFLAPRDLVSCIQRRRHMQGASAGHRWFVFRHVEPVKHDMKPMDSHSSQHNAGTERGQKNVRCVCTWCTRLPWHSTVLSSRLCERGRCGQAVDAAAKQRWKEEHRFECDATDTDWEFGWSEPKKDLCASERPRR
jgi:hypothetical protein